MAELSFPFASIGGDRKIGAETYQRMFGTMFTPGIFPRETMLAVSAAGGMQISVAPGSAVLVRAGTLGYLYFNDAPLRLTVGVADGVADRIDQVVLRWSRLGRSVQIALIQGTPSSTPAAPSLIRTEDTWDMCIARVHVGAGVIEITQGMIEDMRQTEQCGIASSIAQLDSGAFWAQQQDLFDRWFANLTAKLSGDVAGNLFAYCSDLDSRTDGVRVEIVNKQYTIAAGAWAYNAAEMRYEARIEDDALQTYTDAEFQLPDEMSGKISMIALRPQTGYMIVHAPAAPTEPITGTLRVSEVRTASEEG